MNPRAGFLGFKDLASYLWDEWQDRISEQFRLEGISEVIWSIPYSKKGQLQRFNMFLMALINHFDKPDGYAAVNAAQYIVSLQCYKGDNKTKPLLSEKVWLTVIYLDVEKMDMWQQFDPALFHLSSSWF